jgi:hypothetical protein
MYVNLHVSINTTLQEVGNLKLLKVTRDWEVGIGRLLELRKLNLSCNPLTEWPRQLELCIKVSYPIISTYIAVVIPYSMLQVSCYSIWCVRCSVVCAALVLVCVALQTCA